MPRIWTPRGRRGAGSRVARRSATARLPCHRLLPHELDLILTGGLRAFSRDLFEDRIHAPHACDAITTHDRDVLLDTHMYATDEIVSRGRRAGLVWTVLSDQMFDDDPDAVALLLQTWGGEGIYYSARGIPLQPFLRTLGVPSIVVVDVPVQARATGQHSFPPLDRALVGAYRGLHVAADLVHPASLPATAVRTIWQPKDPHYDAYRLPDA